MLLLKSRKSSILLLVLTVSVINGLEFIPHHLKNDYGDALEAIFGMGIKLETLLKTNSSSSQSENFLISPLSITLLLAQLMLGAEGKFQEHLYDLLSLPKHTNDNGELNNYTRLHLQLGKLVHDLRKKANKPKFYTLESSNALFVNRNIKLRPQFQHEVEYLYDTEIYSINFKKTGESMHIINKWASDHTNGLIQNILAGPPGAFTAGIFANAIYFFGKWEQPFSSELNSLAPFYTSPSSSVKATYMTGFLEQVPYAESKRLNCKMLVMPYENRELGMYIILPNVGHPYEYDIKAFAIQAKLTDFLEMLGDLKNRDVVVKMPKLSLSSSLSLLKPLQKYATYKRFLQSTNTEYNFSAKNGGKNVLDVLEDKINKFENFNYNNTQIDEILLGAASLNGELTVSDVLQQMTFSVNEIGTEAAAVSAGLIDYSGGSKSFLANKPFVFFIRHEATAATLFWGSITNPS